MKTVLNTTPRGLNNVSKVTKYLAGRDTIARLNTSAWSNFQKHLGIRVTINTDPNNDPNSISCSDLARCWEREVCFLIKKQTEPQGGNFTAVDEESIGWNGQTPFVKPLLSRTTDKGLYRLYRLTQYISTLTSFQKMSNGDWKELQQELGINVANSMDDMKGHKLIPIAGADLATEWRLVVCKLINDAIEDVGGEGSRLDENILDFQSDPHLGASPCVPRPQ